ncbi:LysR family transcriptional regulator [Corynebacterium mastitidis]
MNAPLNLEHLSTFVSIVEEGTISAAAYRRGLSQPAISRQLAALERHVGQRLVTRSHKEISLTPAGSLLLERAHAILRIAARTVEELNPVTGAISGEIRIGAAETQEFTHLIRAAQAVRNANPAVRFSVHSGGGSIVEEGLQSGDFSFGLFIEPWTLAPYHTIPLPQVDRWGILFPSESPLARHTSIALSEIEGIPLFVPEHVVSPHGLSQWLGLGSQLTVCGTYNLLFNASLMVENGAGAALCIDGLSDHRRTVRFVPLHPPITSRLHLAWPRHRQLSPLEQAFVQALQHQVDEHNLA